MAGYDDTSSIERIRALMAEDGSLSRRAAIIAVVGEGSLRRIEMKMKQQPEDEETDRLSTGLRKLARDFMADRLAKDGLRVTSGKVTSYNADSFWIETEDGQDLRFSFPGMGAVGRNHQVVLHHIGDQVMVVDNLTKGKKRVNQFAPIGTKGLWTWMGATAVALGWLVVGMFTGTWPWALALLAFLLVRGAWTGFTLRVFAEGLDFLVNGARREDGTLLSDSPT